jgi:hypothetical protein
MDSFEIIRLSSISTDDRTFCISRPGPSQKLIESVKRSGVADSPILLRKNNRLIPVSGHNRLNAAASSEFVRCRIVDSFSADDFLQHAVSKLFRGELGPIGKLRALDLVRSDRFTSPLSESVDPVSQLELSPEIATAGILSLDPVLLSYCDDKMVPLKTLLMLSVLSPSLRESLLFWISHISVRMNYFRSAADLLYDLSRKIVSEHLDNVAAEIFAAADSDEDAVSLLFKMRNPVSFEMAEAERGIRAKFRKQGVEIIFPLFMEGSSVEFRIKMMRKDHGASFYRSVGFLAETDPAEILSLL